MGSSSGFIWEPSDGGGGGGGAIIQEARLLATTNVSAGTVINITGDANFTHSGAVLSLPATLTPYYQFILAGSILDLADVTRVSATQIQLTEKVKTNTILRIRYDVPN